MPLFKVLILSVLISIPLGFGGAAVASTWWEGWEKIPYSFGGRCGYVIAALDDSDHRARAGVKSVTNDPSCDPDNAKVEIVAGHLRLQPWLINTDTARTCSATAFVYNPTSTGRFAMWFNNTGGAGCSSTSGDVYYCDCAGWMYHNNDARYYGISNTTVWRSFY
ncbi:MAG: hypothetical protein ACSLE6_12245 [Mycobacterium sp.]